MVKFRLFVFALPVLLSPAFPIRAADPPLPALTEPLQTQAPTVYAERQKAVMNEMGNGIAVVHSVGLEDQAGYRPSSDFFWLTGVEEAGYGDYFIHGLGHFVGLDVHDAGVCAEPLAPGMILTIEPGIDIAEKGLGIRIEDEVLVTETGMKHLTDGLPRTADAIERYFAEREPAH